MAETMALEERVAKLEGWMDEHSRFFDAISFKLTNMERRFEDLDNKIDRFREELDKKIGVNFRWLIGIQITTWITVLLAILFKR